MPDTKPVERVLKSAWVLNVKLMTPVMGDPWKLDRIAVGNRWWKGID